MKYPDVNITLTVDVVLFCYLEGKLKVLTIERDKEPFEGERTLPGGFIRHGETSLDAVERVLREKAGVKANYLEQLYTYDDPSRDPRGHFMSVTYITVINEVDLDKLELNKDNLTEWSDIKVSLGFDHNQILEYALQRLKYKLEYTSAACYLLPELFTLTELQNLYEEVLGIELDKRNFRKKFLKLELLDETDEVRTGLKQRPAALYKFKQKELMEIKRWF